MNLEVEVYMCVGTKVKLSVMKNCEDKALLELLDELKRHITDDITEKKIVIKDEIGVVTKGSTSGDLKSLAEKLTEGRFNFNNND